ncbi:MAG: hydrogen peroxide-inducible genes activator [Betaproteobacteria bacterium]|nr:hydrogen peroxide-inducible genes activator [Betaproteobacteria bacterium]MDH3437524.1 hydrogen peroxide-inducible genes activator [Betaproteobacteria bacterium]
MATLTSLRQLQYLVTLSEKLNFTRAAQACFVTQSTLSAGLKELEDALGARLVERDRQTVLMTPIGIEVTKRARAILAATQDLVEIAAGSRAPMTGLLRLGVIPTIAPFLLPPCLPRLRERYPELHLALREDLTANLLSRLEDGQLDLALIALPYETGNLIVEPLLDDELWIVGRKGDPQVRARAVHVTPSLTDRLLLLEEGHCLRDHALYACGASTHRSTQGMEATSLLTLVQMVESGLGIGLVPEMAVKCGLTESSTLVARPMVKPSPKRTIALVARRSTTRLADLKALAEVILRVSRRLGQIAAER